MTMYHQNTMDFSEWLVAELEKKGWSRSEAARRGGISPSMFDKVINGSSKPGVRFLEGIAKAFKITLFEVTLHLPGKQPADPWVDEMDQKINQIKNPARRKMIESMVNVMVDDEETEQTKQSKSKPRPAGT